MKPHLLIASPVLQDPLFARTVVLVWHYDEQGATGIVVNRPIKTPLSKALNLPVDLDMSYYETTWVSWGGPVEGSMGTAVTRGLIDPSEGIVLGPDVSMTHNEQTLIRLLTERQDLRLCVGYAGWGPGQLDAELAAGGWLYTDINAQLIFDEPSATCYEQALATLGLTIGSVGSAAIEA